MEEAMKTVLFALLVLAAAPQIARADGFIKCNPDDNGSCNTSGVDSASVGSGLLMLGAVAYGIARRKRRR
jgi:MYXO-CTERM domain-containing protein